MMKTSKNFALFLLAVVLVGTAIAQKGVNRPEPKFDREKFKEGAKSVARPDFLACRNTDAKITAPSDLSAEEFAKTLHGVWVNQNRRTVHGLQVETDAAFYIDMKGGSGQAILIDRNNLGDFPLSDPFLKSKTGFRKNARPLTWTFVNCTYQFLDQYIKVSDEVPRNILASSTRLPLKFAQNGGTLKDVWSHLVSAGYFSSFKMVTNKGARITTLTASPVQGDGTRVAVLPDGTKTNENRIKDGMEPGMEYNLPMMTGAFFQISLNPMKATGDRSQGIQMRWDAEYRAIGLSIPVGEPVQGVEQGEFYKEGNAIVSAISISGLRTWTTSECGDKNGLNGAEAVSNPGTITGTDLKPTLIFDRVVIGTP